MAHYDDTRAAAGSDEEFAWISRLFFFVKFSPIAIGIYLVAAWASTGVFPVFVRSATVLSYLLWGFILVIAVLSCVLARSGEGRWFWLKLGDVMSRVAVCILTIIVFSSGDFHLRDLHVIHSAIFCTLLLLHLLGSVAVVLLYVMGLSAIVRQIP